MVQKSPYTKQRPDGSYEYGAVMRPEGARRDIEFPQGTAPNYEAACRLMHETMPLLLDYFAHATYDTPAGGVGQWSGIVLAQHHAAALLAAKTLCEKQRNVAGKLDIKITGERKPLVSLPDLAVILHNAGMQAGDNQTPFDKLAAAVLAYQVPTPPDYDAIGPAAYSRDAGMIIDIQNIIRAGLRAIDAERDRCAAHIDLWHGSTSPAAKAVRNGTPERNHPNDRR